MSTHPWLVVDDEPEYGWDVDLPAPFAGREALSALERIGTTLRETLRNREIAERAGLVHGAVQKVLGGHAGAGADPS